MAERDFLQVVAGEAMEFFAFVGAAIGDPLARDALIRDLGGRPGAAGPGTPLPEGKLDAIATYASASNPGAEAGAQALADIATVLDAIAANIETWVNDGCFDPAAGSQQLARSLIELFGTNYARLNYPRLFLVLQLASLMEEQSSTYGVGNNSGMRLGSAFATIFGFMFQPGKSLEQLDPGPDGAPDKLALATDFAVRVAAVIVGMIEGKQGIELVTDVYAGWDGRGVDIDSTDTPTRADVISQRMTSIALGWESGGPPSDPSGAGQVVISTAMVPKSEGGTALFLAFGGTLDLVAPLGRRWTFTAKGRSDAGISMLAGSRFDFDVSPEESGSQVSFGLASHPPEPEPTDPAPPQVSFSFPSSRGTRLDIGQLGLSVTAASSGAELLLTLADSAVVIEPGDSDGFVAELLGKTPLRLPFELVFGHSTSRGLVLEGGVSRAGTAAPANAPLAGSGGFAAPVVAATIPVGRAFGAVTVHEVSLRVSRGPADAPEGEQTRLAIEADTSFSAHIGPVYVRLDQLGLRAVIDSAAPDPNLGFTDLSLGAKFPLGVAINVETSVIAGGGTILHDPAQGLYFGTLALAIRGGTTVKAIALIATRNPDGSKGFSLVLILTIELSTPYPIGMGFFLEGFGGMLALHRTFDEAAMRAALPTGQLRHVLFPPDPVHRSAELLQAIKTLFPVRRGSHMFGILVKIGWASPTLIRMELAAIYEWGNQNRVIILGRVSATLPNPRVPTLTLNMDAVGVLDIDAGTFALDAVLYDSRLCGRFVLTGAMAMRIGFEGSGFALSVGGLHPRFAAPPGFPSVARLQLALTNGDNPKLICQAYFAITSNTVQFGADCSLYAAAFGFAIVGNVGFDVLIQLLPFHFLAEFRASVQLKRGSRNLFKVSVTGELEGPLPLRVAGRASFEILWCDFSVSFDKTLVDGGTPNDVVRVDTLALLAEALAAPRAWQAALPTGSGELVSLRRAAVEGILLHPLGTLTVRQTVVPLGLARDIDRVGSATPAGERRFAITAARIGAAAQSITGVRELFAPGQFFDMSDDDRLAAPSFEAMEAGATLGGGGYALDFGARAVSQFDYTDITIGPDGNPVLEEEPEPRPMNGAQVLVLTRVSAAAMSWAHRSLAQRFEAPVREAAPRVRRGGWTAVAPDAPAPADAALTWVEAKAMAPVAIGVVARRVVAPRWELAR